MAAFEGKTNVCFQILKLINQFNQNNPGANHTHERFVSHNSILRERKIHLLQVERRS